MFDKKKKVGGINLLKRKNNVNVYPISNTKKDKTAPFLLSFFVFDFYSFLQLIKHRVCTYNLFLYQERKY